MSPIAGAWSIEKWGTLVNNLVKGLVASTAAVLLALGSVTPASAATFNFGWHQCQVGYATYTWANGTGTSTHKVWDAGGSYTYYQYHGVNRTSRTNYFWQRTTDSAQVSGGGISSGNRACWDN